jgi:hypothetical protein
MPLATPVDLVLILIIFLAFREAGVDGQGGEEGGELETEGDLFLCVGLSEEG